jgi:hypothetical protein
LVVFVAFGPVERQHIPVGNVQQGKAIDLTARTQKRRKEEGTRVPQSPSRAQPPVT